MGWRCALHMASKKSGTHVTRVSQARRALLPMHAVAVRCAAMHAQRLRRASRHQSCDRKICGRRYAPARLVSGVLPVVWCCACAMHTRSAMTLTCNKLASFALKKHRNSKQRLCPASDTSAHSPGSRRSRAWRGGLRTQLLVSGLKQLSTQPDLRICHRLRGGMHGATVQRREGRTVLDLLQLQLLKVALGEAERVKDACRPVQIC